MTEVTCEDIEKHLKALLQSSIQGNKETTVLKDSHNKKHGEKNLPESSHSMSAAKETKPKSRKERRKKYKDLNLPSASMKVVDGSPSNKPTNRSKQKNTADTNNYEALFQQQRKLVNGIIAGKDVTDLKMGGTPIPQTKYVDSSKVYPKTKKESSLPEKDVNKRLSVASVLKESGKPMSNLGCEESSSSDSNNTILSKKKKKKKSKLVKQSTHDTTASSDVDDTKEDTKDDSDSDFNYFKREFHHMYDRNGETVSMIRKDTVKWLETEYITSLKKQNERYPDATFYCQLCNYHCSMATVDRHLNQLNHKSMKEVKKNEALLLYMPHPTLSQVKAISKLVEDLSEKQGLDENDLTLRQGVVDRLNKLVQNELLDVPCKFQLYGSSISGLGLKSSNINVDLIVPSVEALSVVLSKLKDVLEKDENICDVMSHFEAKFPSISFVDKESQLECYIGWNNTLSLRTARLLANYAAFDPRVKILCVATRYWAKLCAVDEQDKGTLPAHSFVIMLIYYLQQYNPPVLPVLHELVDLSEIDQEKYLTANEAKKKWICKNKLSVGQLWIDFLRFYSVTFPTKEKIVSIRRHKPLMRAEKKWEGKVIAIEDPMCRKRNLSRSLPNQVVYRYIVERLQHTYKYFGIPQLKSGPLYEILPDEFFRDLRKSSTKPVLEFNFSDANFSQLHEELANLVLDSDASRMPPLESDPKKISVAFDHNYSSSDEDDILEDQDPELSIDQVKDTLLNMDLGEGRCNFRTESESSDVLCAEKDSENDVNLTEAATEDDAKNEDINRPLTLCEEFLKELLGSFSDEDLVYNFDKEILTEGKSPPLWCKLCQQKGHLKDDCPSQILPDLVDLPPMTDLYDNLLSSTCNAVFETYSPKQRELQDRKSVLLELQDFIRNIYPDANLELFGSSCNGFGFTRSDMDICLTFTNNANGEGLDFVKIIENLAVHLKDLNHLHGILPITTAKVPIVKFSYQKELECDISLYNTLAQHNTRMLKLYCNIDDRVQFLGYSLKFFAKLCDIGDASRGSLSSYAYILMVLHFLQQRDPPVIPVLQELHEKETKKPEVIVDGWNAWFNNDLVDLGKIWPNYQKNTETVGQLWLGLLRYYTETFNFKDNVITIKQLAPLTRFEKVWNSKSIAIEDPFDLSHNLGVGLSQNMNTYIMKALIRGRELFGTPLEYIPNDPLSFLFDRHKLVLEPPPNDRGCRICSKIGHKMKECPNRKGGRNRGKNTEQQHLPDRDRTGMRNTQFKDERGYQRENRSIGAGAGGNVRHGNRQGGRQIQEIRGGFQPGITENLKNFLNSAVPRQYQGRTETHEERFENQARHAQYQKRTENKGKMVKLKQENQYDHNKRLLTQQEAAQNFGRLPNSKQAALHNSDQFSGAIIESDSKMSKMRNSTKSNQHQTQNLYPPQKIQMQTEKHPFFLSQQHSSQSSNILNNHPGQLNLQHENPNRQNKTYGLQQLGQSKHHLNSLDLPHQTALSQQSKGMHVNQQQINSHYSQLNVQQMHQAQTNLQSHLMQQGHQALNPYPNATRKEVSQSSHQQVNSHLALSQQQMQYHQATSSRDLQLGVNQMSGYTNKLVYPTVPGSFQSNSNVYNMGLPMSNPNCVTSSQGKQPTTAVPDEAQRMFCRPPMPSPFSSAVWMNNAQPGTNTQLNMQPFHAKSNEDTSALKK